MVMIHAVSIGDIAYNSHWYAMSPGDKVIIEMIIRRSQRPFEIKGLGVLVCSLETFLRVSTKNNNKIFFVWTFCTKKSTKTEINLFSSVFALFVLQLSRSAVSYYMVFRQLNAAN